MESICVISKLFFLLTKNDIIVHYNKIPNLGIYHANYPNLKDPKGPFPKLQKKSLPCSTLALKAPKRMHLKMLSAANNCLTLLTKKSVDPEQTAPIGAHTVCHRGFLNISADEKSRRLLLRLGH